MNSTRGRPERERRLLRRATAALALLTLLTLSAGPSALARPAGPTPVVAYSVPVEGEVVAAFVPPAQVWSAGHRGVDLAAAPGAPVRAAADGTVAFAGPVAGRTVVSIDHADGIRTTYEPLLPSVRAGDRVSGGSVIGTLAEGSHCPAGCLHWGARIGRDTYLDPMTLLSGPLVVRLYPS